jgi:hypothetical protein
MLISISPVKLLFAIAHQSLQPHPAGLPHFTPRAVGPRHVTPKLTKHPREAALNSQRCFEGFSGQDWIEALA